MLTKTKIQFAVRWTNLKEQLIGLISIGKLGLAIFLLLTLSACGKSEEQAYINIYYIPFKVQTYTPVMIQDIEERAFYKFKINSESELSIRLVELLKSTTKGKFDSKVVRLKVEIEKKVYYVDSSGGIKEKERFAKSNTSDIEKLLGTMIKEYKVKKIKEY